MLKGGTDSFGEDVIRPYTPVSSNKMKGAFQLLVKTYPDGVASQMLNNLSVGEEVFFKHTKFNIKVSHPFGKEHITVRGRPANLC